LEAQASDFLPAAAMGMRHHWLPVILVANFQPYRGWMILRQFGNKRPKPLLTGHRFTAATKHLGTW